MSPRRLAFAKWFVVCLPAWLVLFFALAIGGWLLSPFLSKSELAWSLVLLAGSCALFYAIIGQMVVAVSAWARSSHQSLMLLLVAWLVMFLVVPKATSTAAEAWFPTPERETFHREMKREKKQGFDGHDPQNKRVERLRQKVLVDYGVTSEAELPINIDGLLMQEDEDYGNRIFDRYYTTLETIHRKQQQLYRWSALFSPLLPARLMVMRLTQSDPQTHWRFNRQVEQFRRGYVEKLNHDMMKNSRSGEWQYRADRGLWSQVEDFQFDHLHPLQLLRGQMAAWLSLLVWWLVTALILWWLAPRMVRKV